MKTKAEDLLTKISEFEMTLADLKSQVAGLQTQGTEVKTGVIYDEPEIDSTIHALLSDGCVHSDSYNENYEIELLQGNLFYDQASAEIEAKRRAIRHRLSEFCKDAWFEAGMELDWADSSQTKINLAWGHDKHDLYTHRWSRIQASSFVLPTRVHLDALRAYFTDTELKIALTGSE